MSKKIKRWVKNEGDRELLLSLLRNMDAPFTIDIEKGIREKRSTDQNRLQRLWINEAEEQGDMTAEEYRAYCKLHFGVPLLRNENETFAELYDEKVRDRVPPFSYEQKLEFMAIPWDMHVTRLMTVKQHDKYLNMMHDHFTGLGMILTIPNDIDWVQGRDYCKYCKKTLNDLELRYIALHHPDKQLCRPCFVYRQPESQLQKPPLTDEQKVAERERYRAMIDRLKALAEEQNV